MNWVRHGSSATFETKSSYCRVARQFFFLPFSLPSPSSLVLLSSKNSATMVTWRHSSPLYPHANETQVVRLAMGSLRSKREIKREPKNERGGREGRNSWWQHQMSVREPSGMTGQVGGFQNRGVYLQAFPSCLPHPLPALLLAPFFARSLTLVPRSFLLNRTETLATQASLNMGSLRGRCKKGRGRGEGEKLSLFPQTSSPFPFLPVGYPFRRRLAIRADCSKLG